MPIVVIIMRDRKQVAEIPLAELSVPVIMNAIGGVRRTV